MGDNALSAKIVPEYAGTVMVTNPLLFGTALFVTISTSVSTFTAEASRVTVTGLELLFAAIKSWFLLSARI